MHLPAKANSLSVQTFMANKSLSDSDKGLTLTQHVNADNGPPQITSKQFVGEIIITCGFKPV